MPFAEVRLRTGEENRQVKKRILLIANGRSKVAVACNNDGNELGAGVEKKVIIDAFEERFTARAEHGQVWLAFRF